MFNYCSRQDVDTEFHHQTGEAAMKEVKAMRMNAEDFLIYRILIGFLVVPLVLMLVAGAVQALSAG